MLLPFLLIPLLVSGDFLGEIVAEDLSDHELDTDLNYDNNGWTGLHSIMYTYELSSPQQDAVKIGIVLSTDFSTGDPTRGIFMPANLTVNNEDVPVYVVPFRNMQQISCLDDGWNRLAYYANQTLYQFWVDLGGDDCRTLAGMYENARVTRQTLLSQVVEDLSNYATSYISSMNQVANFENDISSVEESIDNENLAIQTTQATIAALQNDTLETQAQIAATQQNISSLQTIVDGLNTQLFQNGNRLAGLQASLQGLQANDATDEQQKATYDQNAASAFATIQNLLQQLILESPTVTSLEGLDSALQLNEDLDAFDNVLRSILPLTTI